MNEGRIPKNRVALKLLAKEMTEWPDLEVQILTLPRKNLLFTLFQLLYILISGQ